MNVKQIVKKYLKENNYDGLCSEYYDCSCDIKDLMPCDHCGIGGIDDCKPGHKIPCPEKECTFGGGCEWHIKPGKKPKGKVKKCYQE